METADSLPLSSPSLSLTFSPEKPFNRSLAHVAQPHLSISIIQTLLTSRFFQSLNESLSHSTLSSANQSLSTLTTFSDNKLGEK